jgi:hypothetical protein
MNTDPSDIQAVVICIALLVFLALGLAIMDRVEKANRRRWESHRESERRALRDALSLREPDSLRNAIKTTLACHRDIIIPLAKSNDPVFVNALTRVLEEKLEDDHYYRHLLCEVLVERAVIIDTELLERLGSRGDYSYWVDPHAGGHCPTQSSSGTCYCGPAGETITVCLEPIRAAARRRLTKQPSLLVDWSQCPLVEVKAGVQSGAPVLRGSVAIRLKLAERHLNINQDGLRRSWILYVTRRERRIAHLLVVEHPGESATLIRKWPVLDKISHKQVKDRIIGSRNGASQTRYTLFRNTLRS